MDKKETRDFYIKIRKNISSKEKNEFDRLIFTQFINSSLFNEFDTFLIYVSVNNEVATTDIINYLLYNNKKVAVPYCIGKEMNFYYINSLAELINGKFDIPSVDINKSQKCNFYSDALCIVPGVSFDNYGNRLGYGGGYYDRFLSENKNCTLGLCYERCLSDLLPTDIYDIKMDFILTEKCIRNHKDKEVSTYG